MKSAILIGGGMIEKTLIPHLLTICSKLYIQIRFGHLIRHVIRSIFRVSLFTRFFSKDRIVFLRDGESN
jgi:hypothetical protein